MKKEIPIGRPTFSNGIWVDNNPLILLIRKSPYLKNPNKDRLAITEITRKSFVRFLRVRYFSMNRPLV